MIGKLIAIEGLDGVGKTFYANVIASRLKAEGIKCMIGQELPKFGVFTPNSSIPEISAVQSSLENKGFHYRKLLQNPDLTGLERLAIVSAARIWHSKHLTIPALAKGENIIMDRYIASTYAYQGTEINPGLIEFFEENIWQAEAPDLNIILVGKQYFREEDDFMDAFSKKKSQEILKLYRAQIEKNPDKWIEIPVDFSSKKTENEIFASVFKLING